MNRQERRQKGPVQVRPRSVSAPDADVTIALQYHQIGRMPEAETIYRRILQRHPDHADALHLLGLLSFQTGRPDEAVRLMTRAVGIKSEVATFHNDLALALRAQSKLDEALTHLQQALVLDPDYAEAHQNLGVVLTDRGELAAATDSLGRALALKPDYAEAYVSLGVILLAHGKQEEAAERFRRAIELKPDLPEAYLNLGALLRDRGELVEAIDHLRRATELKPDFVEAHNILGVALVDHGDHGAAEGALRRAAMLRPDAADIQVNLGVALGGQGKQEEAVESYRRAADLAPNFSDAHFNLGVTLRDRGQLEEAIRALRRAVEFKPDHAEAHLNLGVALGNSGDHEGAEPSLRRALELKPNDPETIMNLGLVLRGKGSIEEGMQSVRRAIELNPDYAEAHHNLGVLLREHNELTSALDSFRRALELKPDLTEGHMNLALALAAAEDYSAAEASARRALELKPDTADWYNNLGAILNGAKKFDEAAESVRRALELKPDFAEAYGNLGVVLGQQRKHDEAVAALRRAVELKPDYAEGHSNLGAALQSLDRVDEAIASVERALALRPDYPEAYHNMAVMYMDQENVEAGIRAFEKATELKPDYADAHFALAMTRLLLGDLEKGFQGYEWRWKGSEMASMKLDFVQPRWDGGPLNGQSIFLCAEQGMGDQMQFARFAPEIARRGGKVILECQPDIVRLLQRVEGVADVIARGAERPPFDVYAPLMSLAGIFGTTLETIPAQVPYLRADPVRAAAWAEYLDAECPTGLRVGLVWAGNPDHKGDRHRSTTLEALAPLGQVAGVHFVALQKGVAADQADTPPAGMDLTNLGSLIGDFDDTAAILEHLDLLITVDTSVAHLAGALGRPVWLLLGVSPDWRWLRRREDNPWYPTARLFRQERLNDWAGVVARVADSLGKLATDKTSRPKRSAARREKVPAARKSKHAESPATYLALPLSGGHGWGVRGMHLAKELALRGPIRLVADELDTAAIGDRTEFELLRKLTYGGLTAPADSPVLQGIQGGDLRPYRPTLRGRFTAGYAVFERNLLPPKAHDNALRYFDLLVAGSTWCREVLESYGLHDVRTIIQGIDPKAFYPLEAEKEELRDRFVVFSGGKFELRKGQDLVIRAFKALQDRHPDVHLVTAWSNPQQLTFDSVSNSPHIRFAPTASDQVDRINQVLADNGIDLDRVTTLPRRANAAMAEVYRSTDVGIFPSRCEGGTNLVLMEYMACGRPPIASYSSGHRDIVNDENAILIRTMGQAHIVQEGQQVGAWDDPNLEETVEALEWAYQNRERLREIGVHAGQDLAQLTWRRTADQIYEILSTGIRVDRSSLPTPGPAQTDLSEEDRTDQAPPALGVLLFPLENSRSYKALEGRLADRVPVDTWQEGGLHFFAFELLPLDGEPALPEPPMAVFAIHAGALRLVSAVVVTPSANGGEPETVDFMEQLAKSA
jgi:tetratricopeptide (TPR) repeat protein/glycosyltransferase involved in cell wall biosynthesis